MLKSIINSVANTLPLGSKILDLGCGPAEKPAILQKLGFDCTGYDDMSDEWHNIDNNKEKILNFAKHSGVKYVVSSDKNPEFEKESFDMLMSNDMLEHLHDSPRVILNDFLEYVKPGGFLFITVPVFLGIYCRKKFRVVFEKKIFLLDRLAFGLFLIIVFIAIFMERNNLINYFDDIGVVIISLLVLIVIVVFTVVNIFVKDIASRRAILIEGLLQNGAMGFVIGSLIYSEVVYLIPIAIYALLQYCVLMFYIGNIKIKN